MTDFIFKSGPSTETVGTRTLMGGILAVGLLAASALTSPALAQQVFQTPEAAMTALIDSARHPDGKVMGRLFGKGADLVLKSGDAEEDKLRLDAFNAAAAQGSKLLELGDSMRVVSVGATGWTFPIPIVKKKNGWQYDLSIGRDEIANRTIGLNESNAIAACKAVNLAQKEYIKEDRSGDGVKEYAQQFVSDPDTHDGLYWLADNALERSPLSETIAWASMDPGVKAGGATPFYGYVFKMLTGQGANAPGGAHSYIENGHMTKGYAMVAYPVTWGQTGVMTFVCGENGKVFQKNLGRNTAQTAQSMKDFDPDKSWKELTDN